MATLRRKEPINLSRDDPVKISVSRESIAPLSNLFHGGRKDSITHVLVFRLPFSFPVID